jgi:hypothetical protein
MNEVDSSVDKLLLSLQERAKELNCLYQVENALNQPDVQLDEAFQTIVDAIPPGWQYPDVCRASIQYGDETFVSKDFETSEWQQSADIVVQDQVVGSVNVWYVEDRPREDIGPFLEEEERLIRTIADRLAHGVLYYRLRMMRQEWENASHRLEDEKRDKWQGAIELLRNSDRDLYLRIARKMLNHLCWTGIEGGQELLRVTYGASDTENEAGEVNSPDRSIGMDLAPLLLGEPFKLASRHLGDDEILALIQEWMTEDKASFLPKVLHNPRATLGEIGENLQRFHHLLADGAELSEATQNGIRVSLIRRFLTDQLDYTMVAKEYLDSSSFIELLDHVLLPAASHGKLGGKTAGLFLAENILRKVDSTEHPVGEFKVPRSWYLPSEGLMRFIEHNDLEEVFQLKYKDVARVRQEYPNVIQLFRNSRMPSVFTKALALVLEEAGNAPLIVRSSSLLEDRFGSAFSGKYKSLFLANQGSRENRLDALLAAIEEIYASVFGPDPIAYRRERGLIDFHEEMGILIQEVVGKRAGRYFLPAAAGVAFSHNEFRWSPRIKREDGLMRLVPGLGTRAVDRISDDYPILSVPGQPKLKVNTSLDEVIRYSPAKIDVIDLKSNRFTTLTIKELLNECGSDYPAFTQVFSIVKDDRLQKPAPLLFRPDRDEVVADLGGLVNSTTFVQQVGNMLKLLQDTLGTPVDIEFAHDGDDLYLLQCRPQGYSGDEGPAPIPKDIPREDIVFSANRFVSNGWIPDISHIVYVDPNAYQKLEERSQLLEVGKVVGKLNKLLPKRQFILMGPGRWGSRGDIKLGVSVTYSDINNSAMLIEIARKKGTYLPDLSFGTHFFQDLVESSIRYLPLYPDDDGSLNELFLNRAPNLLGSILPDHEWLEDVVKVVDVPSSTQNRRLRVLQNSELDQAVGLLVDADAARNVAPVSDEKAIRRRTDDFWQWRLRMVERIAAEIDAQRFGVEALYLIGSTKNANAGPASDIDLLVHCRGDEAQTEALHTWLDGWSFCLSEANYIRTGYETSGLLDVHIISDEDIKNRTSFAAKIGAVTDAAREIPLGKTSKE